LISAQDSARSRSGTSGQLCPDGPGINFTRGIVESAPSQADPHRMGNHADASATNLDRTMFAGDRTVIVPFQVVDFGFVNEPQEIELILFRNFHHFHRF